MKIKNIYKKYPNSSKLLEYKKTVNIGNTPCSSHSNFNCSICYPRKLVSIVSSSSLIRTKTNITDICLSNDFDYFTTFTFDPEKIDSFDFNRCKTVIHHWLKYQKKLNPNFYYLLVPELHKSGRIHFHALLSGYTGKLVLTNFFSNKKPIYNIDKWHYGFSTAIELDKNSERLAYYLQKYITKELITLTNKKRYWVSQSIKRPEIQYNVKVIELMIPTYEEEYFTIYKSIPKDIKVTIKK